MLAITNNAIAGATPNDFLETNNCPASLQPNKSCTIKVMFKPTAKNPRPASIVITGNAQNGPQSVRLSGAGN